ncbi:MAG: IS4 family transposase [Chloroflexales bacterium]
MTTIPQIAAAMHHVLTTVADRAGRLSRMVERSDAKLTGSIFTQTLVFGLGANPHASLSTLTQTTADLGVRVSVEALHQRFDREAALCLEQVLYAAVRQVVAADPVVLPVLDRFPAVVVQDSTTIILPEVLAPIWTGCGGAPHAGNAALKLQLALDLCTGRLLGPQLHNGRESDRNATLDRDLPPGAVRIVDLGFWDLTALADLQTRGVYWFSRAQATTKVQTADDRWWNLLDLLEDQGTQPLDLAVRLGQEAQVPARLIAVPVPEAVAAQRRADLHQEARDTGKPVSAVRLALARWSIFVTTIPVALLSLDEALLLGAARWQIELLIKLWKSHGQIDLVRDVNPWRVLCELYGRLLGQIVQHWLLLVSCWAEPARSLTKAAQTVRTHWVCLAQGMRRPGRLIEAIEDLMRAIQSGCRMNPRRKKPNLYQRFLASAASCAT